MACSWFTRINPTCPFRAAGRAATSEKRKEFAQSSGEQIARLAEMGLTPSRIMTREAFVYSIRVGAALGGSTNDVIHIIATAKRAGVEIHLEDMDEINRGMPLLAEIAPNGPYSVIDVDEAGGIPAVMKELSGLLHLDALTVTGQTLARNLESAPELDRRIIHNVEEPVNKESGIVVLRGNLAPGGAIVRRSAVPAELHQFSGLGRVFSSEQDCIQAMEDGQAREGEVLVVKYEGPRGGPGIREMHRFSNRLKALKSRIALVTDGRFSGADCGLMIGHVTPEAAEKGAIGVAEDGDLIEIDLSACKLNLMLPVGELRERLERFVPQPRPLDSEWMRHYRERVGCAADGAIWLSLLAVKIFFSCQPVG